MYTPYHKKICSLHDTTSVNRAMPQIMQDIPSCTNNQSAINNKSEILQSQQPSHGRLRSISLFQHHERKAINGTSKHKSATNQAERLSQ